MRIIELPVEVDELRVYPLEFDYSGERPLGAKGWFARIYHDPKARGHIGRSFLTGRGPNCPVLVHGLPHGDVLEYVHEVIYQNSINKRRWYGVVLAPDGVTQPSGHPSLRLVECSTSDEALRLARAIRTGDRRARHYLVGGAALAPDLELPRELPAGDLSLFPLVSSLAERVIEPKAGHF